MEEFAGRIAVVTGAGSGIGLALARALAAESMSVVLADIEEAALEKAAADVAGSGAEVLAVPTDVSAPTAMAALADAAYDRFGAVHVLCNNAGVSGGGLSWEIPLEDWDWVLGVNLRGVINGVHAFVPRMVAGGDDGHIVNTASVAGLVSTPFMASYNVSKHGVVALSETMSIELAMVGSPLGVSVVCPGWVRTRIHEADRNRPGGPAAGDDDPRFVAVRAMVEEWNASGMDPADVAAQVLAAIRDRRFYVKTHAAMEGLIRKRHAAIEDGTDPPMSFPSDFTAN